MDFPFPVCSPSLHHSDPWVRIVRFCRWCHRQAVSLGSWESVSRRRVNIGGLAYCSNQLVNGVRDIVYYALLEEHWRFCDEQVLLHSSLVQNHIFSLVSKQLRSLSVVYIGLLPVFLYFTSTAVTQSSWLVFKVPSAQYRLTCMPATLDTLQCVRRPRAPLL